MPKRKAKELREGDVVSEPRRSTRRRMPGTTTGADTARGAAKGVAKPPPSTEKAQNTEAERDETADTEDEKPSQPSKPSKPIKRSKNAPTKPTTEDAPPTGRQYWLMKAEPESRIEKGHDIKFSIDDLAAKTEPEPWDGIRAYPARNNLRAMQKGDLAFFYHSSCKTPAIVGIMEIVQEHTPDLSAHNPSAPYYDPSSTPENPKWSVVHVVFRQKLKTPITLRELRGWFAEGGGGHPIGEMQMLKLGRLSVSRVREGEWRFLVEEMGRRGDVVRED